MQSLPDEQSAGRAQCALSFFKAADVPELLEVVLDPACDHPDDDAAGSRPASVMKRGLRTGS